MVLPHRIWKTSLINILPCCPHLPAPSIMCSFPFLFLSFLLSQLLGLGKGCKPEVKLQLCSIACKNVMDAVFLELDFTTI